jgi:hypothetical protein
LIQVIILEMPLIRFESIVNLIQLKLMKVIDTLKNMMIQGFQHFVEFQLIQVVKMKMQMIQFESIVNLIQLKLMKALDTLKNMMIQEFQHFVEFQLM